MEILDVLVVDDEFGIRTGVSRILRNFTVSYPFMDEDIGFNIIEAATGEQALEIIQTAPPAIVLLDNKLPGIQGVDVLEQINSTHPDTLVIMITSYASLEVAVKATRIGAYDFVPKPFNPQEIKASMENVAKHYYLRRMTRKLHREGKQIRFQFLSLLSHELKTPLNALEGYLKIMQGQQAGSSMDAYMEMIDRSLARVKAMRTMILDLLDLTRLESGKKERVLQRIDIVQIAKASVDTLTPLAIQRDVTMKLDSESPVILTADPEEMEIMFNNLLSNAVKYNKPSGRVTCTILANGGTITITVSDTGVGISPEDMPKLFKEFSRIQNPQTKDVGGSGLGLSIVKRIVELNKGHIVATSTPNEGTKFTITIPTEGNTQQKSIADETPMTDQQDNHLA